MRPDLPLVSLTLGTRAVGSGTVIGHSDDHSDIIATHHQIGRKRCGAVTYRIDGGFAGCRFDVVKRDHKHDLILLRTSKRIPVPAATISSIEPRLYEALTAIGCPATLFGTVVDCKLTARDGSNGIHEDMGVDSLYQLSMPVGFGMSGGPLLDSRGELVGVITSGIDEAFVSFATPLGTLRAFLGEIP